MLALVAGCGSDSISIEDLPDEVKDARCDNLVRCEGVVDRATCDAAVVAANEQVPEIKAGIANGTIKYSSGKAGDCVDELSGESCEFTGLHNPSACSDILSGTVATGGACTIDEQCANHGECAPTDDSCNPSTACCAGTCAGGTTESALGGPCDDEMHTCAATAYCKTAETGPGTCTALVTAEGGACDELAACVNPLYCNLNFQTGVGACKKPAASNAACSRMDLLPCADGRDYCNATSLTCVRRVAVGAACSAMAPCVNYASCVTGTCQADIPLGGTCNPQSGADCAGDLDCVGTTCQVPAAGPVCAL